MKKILSMALATIMTVGSVTAYAVEVGSEGTTAIADGVVDSFIKSDPEHALLSDPASSSTSADTNKSVTDYSYTITPLLEPFNEYFFVKTDNPDPTSFRFSDKSSEYGNDDTDAYIYAIDTIYADINYEDSETGRVNGGYIFSGSYTDGGEVILQSKTTGRYYWEYTWDDTDLKYNLPALKDDTDYLIDTYANKSEFFDNMDAVQEGFSNICLYSGSYVRGELYKAGEYWSLSNSPHVDQIFYLQSPYRRNDSQSLFASAIYPFRYDSLGFPSMMGSVSKRLDSASSYVWSSYSHAHIEVTYNGETRVYGGQGNGFGQGIEKSDIKQFFTFGTNGTKITLDSAKELLIDYGNIKVPDDVPREDALTWKDVYDTVGSGSWVRLVNIGSIFGATGSGYAYLYRKGDGSYFSGESLSGNGTEIYWGGDIGYASDAWVDGRYVDSREIFAMGEKFEDHPTSDIILKDFTVPQIKYSSEYEYNSTSGKYEIKYTITSITETKKTVKFMYNSTENVWRLSSSVFDHLCANDYMIADLVDRGVLDKKYLDMVILTLDEVKALEVDKNTNTLPEDYYIYDSTCEPGTKHAGVVIPIEIKVPETGAPDTSDMAVVISGDGFSKTISIGADGMVEIGGIADGDYTFTFSANNCAPRAYDATIASSTVTGLEDGVELHLYGDLDGDGKVNMKDVGKANAHAKNTAKLSGYDLLVCDINGDGKINMQDVGLMNAHAKNTKSLW